MTDEHARAGHSHVASKVADYRYLTMGLGLIVAFMVVEVGVAFVSGSRSWPSTGWPR